MSDIGDYVLNDIKARTADDMGNHDNDIHDLVEAYRRKYREVEILKPVVEFYAKWLPDSTVDGEKARQALSQLGKEGGGE